MDYFSSIEVKARVLRRSAGNTRSVSKRSALVRIHIGIKLILGRYVVAGNILQLKEKSIKEMCFVNIIQYSATIYLYTRTKCSRNSSVCHPQRPHFA